MKFKLYKSFYIALIFMFCVVCISFSQFMNSHFSKKAFQEYELYKEKCKNSYEDSICKKYAISDRESYEREVENSVVEQRKKLNVKYLTYTILEHYLFYYVCLFMPLITAILVCIMISKDINTGFYQHIFVRENYKSYLFKKIKSISLLSILQPLSIFVVFIISMFLANFNFNNSDFEKGLAVYSAFKDHYFLFSVFLSMLITFILNFIFGIISMIVSVKEKSVVVSITKSYLICVAVHLLDYFIGNLFILKLLNMSTLNFDILSYFVLNSDLSFPIVFGNLFVLLVLSCLIFFMKFGRKEQFYGAIEKENTTI